MTDRGVTAAGCGSWHAAWIVCVLVYGLFAGMAAAAQPPGIDEGVTPAAAAGSISGDGDWGLGVGVRVARVPMVSSDRYATDVVPLLYYQGERVFLDGTEGGIRIGAARGWEASVLGRIRFFDRPRNTRGEIRSDARDIGLQLRHPLTPAADLRFDALSAGSGRHYLDAGVESLFGSGGTWLRTYLGMRFKNARFNDDYLGLGQSDIGPGADLRGRVELRRHLVSNLHLLASVGLTRLDENARGSPGLQDKSTWEVFTGVGVFDTRKGPRVRGRKGQGYLRASWGWATPSNLGEIVRLSGESDREGNSLSSLFYGHQIGNRLFGFPIDLYLTGGLVNHHRSRVQNRSMEYVVAIKGYHTVEWPVRVRFGLAEGLSYVADVPYVERSEMERKGYRPSKLLNYLDLSVDLNAGDLLGKRRLHALWIGYAIHHRSGVFETGSQFGEIHGGSNYNTLYLQWQF